MLVWMGLLAVGFWLMGWLHWSVAKRMTWAGADGDSVFGDDDDSPHLPR